MFMDFPELFWNAKIDDIKNGYVYTSEKMYVCLCCGEKFIDGIIYQNKGEMCDANYAISNHIKEIHHSPFHFFLELDKKYTALTDTQKELMREFYDGKSDKEIAKAMNCSQSTVRNHRFQLRERMKQAKMYLSLMELLEVRMSAKKEDKLISIHRSATSIDDRYAITEKDREDCLQKYFKDHVLITIPKKQKRIIIVLQHIITRFETNKIYCEKEVNEILKVVYHDYVTIRRYLIEYGFLDRKHNGSEYWVKL